MPHYKLTYFDQRIRGELIRWLFAVAKQPFEDHRISLPDWPQQKSNYLFGQLPVLEVDGQQLAQSQAILNYLAREFGLAGKTSFDQARVNMIALTVEDALFRHTPKILYEVDSQKQAELIQHYANETLPDYLSKFEELLGEKPFFVGDELTYADLVVIGVIEEVENSLGITVDLSKYPGLEALKIRVQANPGLAEWLATRPPRSEKPLYEILADYSRAKAAAAAAQKAAQATSSAST